MNGVNGAGGAGEADAQRETQETGAPIVIENCAVAAVDGLTP